MKSKFTADKRRTHACRHVWLVIPMRSMISSQHGAVIEGKRTQLQNVGSFVNHKTEDWRSAFCRVLQEDLKPRLEGAVHVPHLRREAGGRGPGNEDPWMLMLHGIVIEEDIGSTSQRYLWLRKHSWKRERPVSPSWPASTGEVERRCIPDSFWENHLYQHAFSRADCCFF